MGVDQDAMTDGNDGCDGFSDAYDDVGYTAYDDCSDGQHQSPYPDGDWWFCENNGWQQSAAFVGYDSESECASGASTNTFDDTDDKTCWEARTEFQERAVEECFGTEMHE